jgi:hypothetical protein
MDRQAVGLAPAGASGFKIADTLSKAEQINV